MDNSTVEQPTSTESNGKPNPENGSNNRQPVVAGVAYPVETLDNILNTAQALVSEHGSGRPITKEEIGKSIGKSWKALSQYFSTFVQYGVFNIVHGKGYVPTDLYKRYVNWVHEGDQDKCKMEMIRKPSLYSKIFDNLTDHTLPTDSKRFAHLLKEEPYKLSEFGAVTAAKVFLDNAKNLNLLDSHNNLKAHNSENGAPKAKEEPKHDTPPLPKKEEPELFELPIPLGGTRKAYIRYPLSDLKKKDIKIIVKALAFIASSIEEEGDDEFEITIKETKKGQE